MPEPAHGVEPSALGNGSGSRLARALFGCLARARGALSSHAAQLGWLVSASCLVLAFRRFDPGRLTLPAPRWLLLGLACALLALGAAAWRWQFVARRLGLALSPRAALAEVVAASLLNQVLPGGVAGELLRVVHHGDRQLGYPRALRAVALDRAFGQLSLWLCALLAGGLWLAGDAPHAWWWLAGASLLAVALATIALIRTPSWLVPWIREAGDAARAGGAWWLLGSSLLLVTACIGLFTCSSLAIGAPLAPGDVWRIAPPLLLTMAIPVAPGGLGLREAVAGALYAAAGLDSSAGNAAGAVYGALALLASLPGAWVIARARRRRS